jgi:putative phage-type endonuclease
MSLTAQQIEARRFAVGGSECAIALGISNRMTALQLYLEKRGEIEREEVPADSEVIWWGNALEPVVRQKYAEVTGRVVVVPGTIVHPAHHFMIAHLDGVSYDGEIGNDPRGYEGKTAFLSTGWGEEGTDQIPEDYLMQVHHYMICAELPSFDVCSLIGRRFAYYHVEPDHELQEMIVEGERDFIRRVREGDPPPLDYQHRTAIDVIKKLYPGTNNQRLVANDNAIAWRTEMVAAAEAGKAAWASSQEFRTRLLESMGEAALLAFPDGKCLRRQITQRAGYTVEPSEFIDFRAINDPSLPKKGKKR